MQTKIILASQSPRRHELFARLGLPFEKAPAEVNEIVGANTNPIKFAEEMAVLKAETMALIKKGFFVVGADTVVEIDGKILGKPFNEVDAFKMLSLLNGRTHRVVTGIAIIDPTGKVAGVESRESHVEFKKISEKAIRKYISDGEPMDKAGAYAIQGKGRFFIHSVNGCYNNIVGLPLCLLIKLLRKGGINKGKEWDRITSLCCAGP